MMNDDLPRNGKIRASEIEAAISGNDLVPDSLPLTRSVEALIHPAFETKGLFAN